jgi:hypothetical protein
MKTSRAINHVINVSATVSAVKKAVFWVVVDGGSKYI